MLIYSIYKITNKTNGKSYIGVTNDYQRRIRQHKHCAKRGGQITHQFYNDIRQYGWNDFECSIIFSIIDQNQHTIDQYERQFIEEFGQYNMASGGKKDYKLSEQTKALISQKHMGKIVSEESKKKMSLSKIGKPAPNRGKPGKPVSEETRQKLRIARANQKQVFKQVTCPHCGRQGALNQMNRFHFDKCKFKPLSLSL